VIVAPWLDAEDDAERFLEKSAAPRGDGRVCEPQKFLAPARIVSKDSRAQLYQQKLCSSDCTLTANPDARSTGARSRFLSCKSMKGRRPGSAFSELR
jgi:hypothetical protein